MKLKLNLRLLFVVGFISLAAVANALAPHLERELTVIDSCVSPIALNQSSPNPEA